MALDCLIFDCHFCIAAFQTNIFESPNKKHLGIHNQETYPHLETFRRDDDDDDDDDDDAITTYQAARRNTNHKT